MIDELILHIGMPKTGTTSIQRALNAVREGEDWTYLDLNPPHSSNPVILRAFGGVTSVSTHPGPRTAHTVSGARDHLSKALSAVRTPRAILSAEAMVRLPPAAVAELLAHLKNHARSIKAVAYIRPPSSFITSYVQQFFKTGYAPLKEVLRKAQRPVSADIALWDHALGVENMLLFPFTREAYTGGSVVPHFAQALNLGPLPEQPKNANVSLGGEATRLMVQYRRTYPTRGPRDGRILFRLGKLGGEPFLLHAECLAEAGPMIEATEDWALQRMGWRMPVTQEATSGRAIRGDADFDELLPQTLGWLSSTTDFDFAELMGDQAEIAKAVRALGAEQTGQSFPRRLARRLRWA